MDRIKTLRKQHDLIEDAAADILQASRHMPDKHTASAVLHKLQKLDEILTAHLNAEDGFLYPELAQSEDPNIATLATRFFEEMGGLMNQYTAFKLHWSVAERLRDHPIGFRSEFKAIVAALSIRIHRENEELYPLAERSAAGAQQGRAAA